MSEKSEVVLNLENAVTLASADAKPMLAQIGMQPEAFARVAMNALMMNPEIANCTTKSLRRALLSCAQRGVLPDGEQAAIVPYKRVATLQMGYKGMCDLARRGIQGVVLKANLCVEGDEWEHEEGLNQILRHVPKGTRGTEKNVLAAYALAWMPENKVPEFVVLYRGELDYIRSTYVKHGAVWAKEFGEQCKKTAMRRLCKMLPIRSGLLVAGFDPGVSPLDDDLEDEPAGDVIDVQPTKPAEPEPAATPAPRRRRAAATRAAAPPPPPAEEPPPPDDDGGAVDDEGDDF